MIVKVQQSLATSAEQRQMLVYNEDRTVFGQFPVTQEVLAVLSDRPKVFFHAEVDETGFVQLSGEAPWQEW